jgi:hypothetical protein
MTRHRRRIVGSVVIAAVVLFAFEGVVTTFFGGSLLRRLPFAGSRVASGADLAWRSRTEDERALAAASSPGVLRLHPDPRVGYVLRSEADLDIAGGTIRSDELGLRRRPRPMPPGDPLVVAVAGASIPFGYGLCDEDTIAHRLEEQLQAARGPQARPVVCRTVAMGRWSTRNTVSFLLDHLVELEPDVVAYMVFPNELSDTDIVSESGHREAYPDPTAADPWLSVRADHSMRLLQQLRSVQVRNGQLQRREAEAFAPDALTADLSPESARRYDESAECLLHLAQVLRAHGKALILLPIIQHDHAYHLLARVWSRLPGLPVSPLLTKIPAELSLGHDPHPNAATARVLATLVARGLFAHGLLDRGAGLPLPGVPAECASLLAPPYLAAEVAVRSADRRDRARAQLQPTVDFTSGAALEQILGGVSVNGLVGPRVLLLLAPGGPALELELAPLDGRPDLYPLDVGVEVDGVPAGVVTVTAACPARARLAVPSRPDPGAPMEVRLVAPRWVVVRIGGTFETAAFRPVRIACGG